MSNFDEYIKWIKMQPTKTRGIVNVGILSEQKERVKKLISKYNYYRSINHFVIEAVQTKLELEADE